MSFKTIRERFNEKLNAMTPEERHFLADDALISAIDDALAELVEAAKPVVIKASDTVKPSVKLSVGTPIVVKGDDEGK